MRAPPVWEILMEFWAIPGHLRRRWWQAVFSARWSRVAEWRQKLVLAESTRLLSARHLLCTVCSPAETVAVLEALCSEERLSRRTVSEIEEYVLRRADHQGEWRGDRQKRDNIDSEKH